MPDYPILVERWDDKHPSDLAVCEHCHREGRVDPSEGDPYDLCVKCANCGGQIVMKYDEGVRCRNCGKLDYSMPKDLGGCCSRPCMLQSEYARQLEAYRGR